MRSDEESELICKYVFNARLADAGQARGFACKRADGRTCLLLGGILNYRYNPISFELIPIFTVPVFDI
jgi:hypothetical protein